MEDIKIINREVGVKHISRSKKTKDKKKKAIIWKKKEKEEKREENRMEFEGQKKKRGMKLDVKA